MRHVFAEGNKSWRQSTLGRRLYHSNSLFKTVELLIAILTSEAGDHNLKTLLKILLLLIISYLPGSLIIPELSAEPEESLSPLVSTKTFGCLLPLSGRYKDIGEKALEGILAAAESMPPGVEYRVVVKDIGESQEKLRGALKELGSVKDLSFIVGPIPSLFIPAVIPQLNSKKIPTVVFPVSEGGASGGPYLIKFYYPVEEQARVLAGYAVKELGVKSYAVLYPDTSLGRRMKDVFIKALRKNGGNTVYEGSYDSSEREIGDEVLWISSKSPEGVFIADGSSASAELIVKLKQEGGLSDVLFLGPSTWNGSLFQELAGREIDGFVYRAIFTDFFYYGGPEWDSFMSSFEKKFRKTPSYLEYQSYLATRLLLSVDSARAPGKDLMQNLTSLGSDPDYIVRKESDGSIRVSPRYLILSIEDGELSEITSVR